MRRLAIVVLILLAARVGTTIPVSAHANLVQAEPGMGASVRTAPTSVRLSFSEVPEPRYSDIDVFGALQERFDTGEVRVAPNDKESLIVSVRDLPQGIYTVVWKTTSAVDGHTTGGSFAFGVGMTPPTGTTAAPSTVTFTPPSPLEVTVKWLLYLSLSLFLGTLVHGIFIWTPAIASAWVRHERDEALTDAVNARLGVVTHVALVALVVSTVMGVFIQVAKVTARSLIGVLNADIVRGYLVGTRTGGIWLVRLVLAFVMLLILGANRLAPVRLPQRRRRSFPSPVLHVGLVLGTIFLLTIALTSHSAATAFATPATVAIDWLHLMATAVWVGGLVGLAASVPLIAHRTAAGRLLLRDVVARFSTLALSCVALLVLTGLYSAWMHVGSPAALTSTTYGSALVIKLLLVVGLVALGAFNLLWVRPRLALGTTTTGEHKDLSRPPVRHFRRAIDAEIVLAAGVLFVVAVLTGLAPSREALMPTGTTRLTQRANADDVMISLTPSALEPGTITYDVLLTPGKPVQDVQRVVLRFACPAFGVDETEAVTVAQGDGHFVVTGPYTAIAGNWQTRVIVRRAGKEDVSAAFTLPIGGLAVPTPMTRAPTPIVTAGILVYGTVAVVFVLAVLIVAPLTRMYRGVRTDGDVSRRRSIDMKVVEDQRAAR